MTISCRILRFSTMAPVIFASALAFSAEPSGVTAKEILIGESVNKTGVNPERSTEIAKGSDLVFNKVNSEGGVHGRKIKVVSYDDGYDGQKAAENVKKLLNDDKVFMIFQTYGTTPTSAALPLIERADVPLFAPITGVESLRTPVKKNVFNVRASYTQEALEMARFLAEKKKVKSIGVLYQDDAFGQSGVGATQSAIEKVGIKRSVKASFPRNTADIANALKEIKAAAPEAVVIWATAKPAGTFIREAVKSGFKPVFMVASPAQAKEFNEAVVDTSAEIYFTESVPLVPLICFAIG